MTGLRAFIRRGGRFPRNVNADGETSLAWASHFVGELRGEAHLSFGVVCKLDIPLVMLIPARVADKAG
jgi:hypothetical protein